MQEKNQSRDQVIVRTSLVGIGANVLLAALKATVGLLSNSIAVVLDAVHNLSDALSSVITIAGAKLAARKPDKKHPLGYGRIEYLSAMIIAAIVLYAGLSSLVESVKKIIHPETASYGLVTLLILAAAVAVKLVLGSYVKRKGEQVNSGSLVASGKDASFDAILSASVLLSALVYLKWKLSLEAYVGAVISLFIIRSGLEMLTETLDDILGKRMDPDFVREIKQTIVRDEAAGGAYDLILHSYGPERYIGSVHVEVPDAMTADEIDAMERRIAQNVYREHGVILAGISIYAMNTKNEEVKALRSEITHRIMSHDGVLQIHGFYADPQAKRIQLDLILDLELEDREERFREIRKDLEEAFPDYELQLNLDLDL